MGDTLIGTSVPGKICGALKWFSTERGYGFIVCRETGREAILHQRFVDEFGYGPLATGCLIEAQTRVTPKGLRITRILGLHTEKGLLEPRRTNFPTRMSSGSFSIYVPPEYRRMNDALDVPPSVLMLPSVLRGTLISTDQYDAKVQDLRPGDRVLTMNGGFDTVERLIDLNLPLSNETAPVYYPAQSAGNYQPLWVSPTCKVVAANGLAGTGAAIPQYDAPPVIPYRAVVLTQESSMMAQGAIVSAVPLKKLEELRLIQEREWLYSSAV